MTTSAPALRAALAIKAKYGGVAIGITDDARIIDEATSLPLLLAALKRLCKPGNECTCDGGGPGFQCDLCQGREALKTIGENYASRP